MIVVTVGTGASEGAPLAGFPEHHGYEDRKQSTFVYISQNGTVVYVDVGVNPYPYVRKPPRAVFLTHWHSDHVAGLFSLRWMRPGFHLYAPANGELAKHFIKNPKNMKIHTVKKGDVIHIDDFVFQSFQLNHSVETYGYLIRDGLNTVAHVLDTDGIPEDSLDFLHKVDLDAMVLDGTFIGSLLGGRCDKGHNCGDQILEIVNEFPDVPIYLASIPPYAPHLYEIHRELRKRKIKNVFVLTDGYVIQP